MKILALAAFALAAVVGAMSARAEPQPYQPSGPDALSARSPEDVTRVLRMNGAAGALKVDELDAPYFIGEVGGTEVIAVFFGCNVALTRCRRILYGARIDQGAADDTQMSDWNLDRPPCRIERASPGQVWVWRPSYPFAQDTGTEAMADQRAWLGCLSDFRRLAGAPDAAPAHQAPD